MSRPDLVELEGVTKRYGSEKSPVFALRGVSLTVSEGDYLAVTGPSGSGKSTLLNLIGTLHRPTSGNLRLFGRDATSYGRTETARLRNQRFGFVFQDSLLIPSLTLIENVCLPLVYAGLPRRLRQEKALGVLEELGLAERQSHLPSELSGGENQRAAIARAIVNQPTVVLADEPTGNLDQENSSNIMRILDQMHRAGRTIIVVSHDPEVVRHCHRIVSIVDGRIATPA